MIAAEAASLPPEQRPDAIKSALAKGLPTKRGKNPKLTISPDWVAFTYDAVKRAHHRARGNVSGIVETFSRVRDEMLSLVTEAEALGAGKFLPPVERLIAALKQREEHRERSAQRFAYLVIADMLAIIGGDPEKAVEQRVTRARQRSRTELAKMRTDGHRDDGAPTKASEHQAAMLVAKAAELLSEVGHGAAANDEHAHLIRIAAFAARYVRLLQTLELIRPA
jgi:hypothetical protein